MGCHKYEYSHLHFDYVYHFGRDYNLENDPVKFFYYIEF
jgi:hypothetical protein